MPKKVKGKATGWVYILVKQWTQEAAEYHTNQKNGVYNVIFCKNNLKDGAIDDISNDVKSNDRQ